MSISCCDGDDRFFPELYSSLRKSDYRSQIVGCHGTGKTTFLTVFVPYLERHNHNANHVILHDGQRTLPREFWERHSSLVSQFKSGTIEKPSINVIDGYEQLSLAQKIRLRLCFRKGQCGLLITTHTPAWRLPVLMQTESNYETLQSVMAHLFRNQPNIKPPNEILCRSLFEQHQGNIRNVLFDLYDDYEARASGHMFQNSEKTE